jgi:hypothetical protein
VVHNHSFAFQKHANPAITKPPPLAGNRLHLFANFWIIPLSSKLRFDCRAVGRLIAPDGLGIDTPSRQGRILTKHTSNLRGPRRKGKNSCRYD